MGAWQSHHINKRLLRRFTPRNDILLIALVLIKISDKEKLLIETLIRSTKFGNDKLFLTETILKDENFIKLRKRLKLDLTNIAIEQERGFLGELKESLKFLLSRLRKKR
jgi:hypothetical protein